MARSPSGGRPASTTNGRSREALPAGALEDEPTLAARDQTLADADQTASDTDQTLSDVDQTSADSDQTSADCDQVAADKDQAASDHDLATGGDPEEHDVSQGIRERSTNQRERTAEQRHQSAGARLRAGEQRDAIADDRDVAALARDQAAAAREIAMVQARVVDEGAENAPALSGADLVVRAAGQRRRAAEQRANAAEYRARAAEDRRMAERDREAAARERRRSLVDREMFAAELDRVQELRAEGLRHQHRAEQLAGALQRSLSPPSLPPIAGLDVAVHCEPCAPEDVGGDFYDVFPMAAGRTGFFFGDVCGKGPEAAAVTSLARYTMRTAAMLRELPDAILMDLNAALLMHNDGPMRTCTAVYGQIDMSSGAAAVTLAVAGHPRPLIVRKDGSVQPTSAHGTMLGAFDDPAFHTCAVHLGPGDAILIYSDGLLDTRLGGDRIDARRVAGLLAGTSHASAQDLVDRLMRALDDVDRPLRDDMAIMTLQRTPAG